MFNARSRDRLRVAPRRQRAHGETFKRLRSRENCERASRFYFLMGRIFLFYAEHRNESTAVQKVPLCSAAQKLIPRRYFWGRRRGW